MVSLDIYVQEVLNFLRTVTIKNSHLAAQVARSFAIKHRSGEDLEDAVNPYYLHMVGQYCDDDTLMKVTALESGGATISFDRDVLDAHPKTAAHYRIPQAGYDELERRYPTQSGLIKSIVYPASDLEQVLAADDFSRVACDPTLLEETERESMLARLDATLDLFRTRWVVPEFHYEEYVPNLTWVALDNLLFLELLDQRMANIKTSAAHTFHIWMHLKSRGIADYRNILNRKQELYLYRNIDYLIANSGKMSNLRELSSNLLEEFGVTVRAKSVLFNSGSINTCKLLMQRLDDAGTPADERASTLATLRAALEQCPHIPEVVNLDLNAKTPLLGDAILDNETLATTIKREYKEGLEPTYPEERDPRTGALSLVDRQTRELASSRYSYLPTKLMEITKMAYYRRYIGWFCQYLLESMMYQWQLGNYRNVERAVELTDMEGTEYLKLGECIALFLYLNAKRGQDPDASTLEEWHRGNTCYLPTLMSMMQPIRSDLHATTPQTVEQIDRIRAGAHTYWSTVVIITGTAIASFVDGSTVVIAGTEHHNGAFVLLHDDAVRINYSTVEHHLTVDCDHVEDEDPSSATITSPVVNNNYTALVPPTFKHRNHSYRFDRVLDPVAFLESIPDLEESSSFDAMLNGMDAQFTVMKQHLYAQRGDADILRNEAFRQLYQRVQYHGHMQVPLLEDLEYPNDLQVQGFAAREDLVFRTELDLALDKLGFDPVVESSTGTVDIATVLTNDGLSVSVWPNAVGQSITVNVLRTTANGDGSHVVFLATIPSILTNAPFPNVCALLLGKNGALGRIDGIDQSLKTITLTPLPATGFEWSHVSNSLSLGSAPGQVILTQGGLAITNASTFLPYEVLRIAPVSFHGYIRWRLKPQSDAYGWGAWVSRLLNRTVDIALPPRFDRWLDNHPWLTRLFTKLDKTLNPAEKYKTLFEELVPQVFPLADTINGAYAGMSDYVYAVLKKLFTQLCSYNIAFVESATDVDIYANCSVKWGHRLIQNAKLVYYHRYPDRRTRRSGGALTNYTRVSAWNSDRMTPVVHIVHRTKGSATQSRKPSAVRVDYQRIYLKHCLELPT